MIKNNNQGAVKRLTRRSVKNNRTRNIFAIIAIILTTFMISATFSVGISAFQNSQTMIMRMEGTIASILLNQPTEEQTAKIKQIKGVKAVGTQISVGQVFDGKPGTEQTDDDEAQQTAVIRINYLDQNEYETNITPCISGIHGTYPKAQNEVMMSLHGLALLGFTTPTLTMEVPLTYTGVNGEVTESFRLSGYYTDYSKELGREPIAFVSKAYCDTLGITAQQNGQLSISSKLMAEEKVYDTIRKEIKLNEGQELSASIGTMGLAGTINATALIVMLALFMVLSGYLLIYNIIYISVTKETRFFGLLKTIGTSPRQIKKIVRNQIYLLSLIGIPIGTGLGIISSFLLMPYIFNNQNTNKLMPTEFSFHPVIFIGTALFALLAIAWASRRPAKLAANIAPVEAMNYTGVVQKEQKNRRSTKGGKPYKMAWYNIFREKRRAILVFTSLFMGTITFLCVNSFVNSMGVNHYIDRYYPHDFALYNLSSSDQTFNRDFINQLKKIDGVETVKTNEFGTVRLNFAESEDADDNGLAQNLKNNPENADIPLYSIDADDLKNYNNKYQTDLDSDAFERGEYCFLGYAPGEGREAHTHMIGKELTFTNPDTGVQRTVKIGGIFDYADYASISSTPLSEGNLSRLFASRNFVESVFPTPIVSAIKVDVEQDKEPQIKQAINNLMQDITSSYKADIRSDIAKQFSNDIERMNVLGGGISTLLILVGLINFVNVTLTGVYIRRKELAVLESVGMTKKQIYKMLICEGLYYALITTGLILTLGNLALWFVSENITSIADYAVFHYPFAIIGIIIAAILAVCLSVPGLVFRTLSKESVTERLHQDQ